MSPETPLPPTGMTNGVEIADDGKINMWLVQPFADAAMLTTLTSVLERLQVARAHQALFGWVTIAEETAMRRALHIFAEYVQRELP
jgi:hypothetical protein